MQNAGIFSKARVDSARDAQNTTQAAVFTWYGCTIETTGWVSSIYVAQETPMKSYVNTHAQLEARRDKALQALQAGRTNVTGPRVSFP